MRLFALHLGNTAGVAWTLTQTLTSLGRPSKTIELEPLAEGFPADVHVDMTKGSTYLGRVVSFARMARMARNADLVHFHGGFRGFSRHLRRLCATPFFVHFHGSDLREGIADGYRELAAFEFVATPDLLRRAPHAKWIPNPVRLNPIPPHEGNLKPLVGHFPTSQARKGTGEIQQGIRQLRDELDFDFRILTGVPHQRAIDAMSECDIVVDQLNEYGVYGNVAVEGMLLGKVVVSSIRPEYYRGCPIVAATKQDFVIRMRELLSSPDRWASIGNAGKQYARTVHDPVSIATELIGVYEKYL